MNPKKLLGVVSMTLGLFAVGLVAQTCNLNPDNGCPTGGSATNLSLQMGPFLGGGQLCGPPPYNLQTLNLYNLSAQFTASSTGDLDIEFLKVWYVDGSGNNVYNALTWVYLSSNFTLPGLNIVLTAVVGPPGLGVWRNTTYYGQLTDIEGHVIWCVSGAVLGSLIG